jgi:translation initiation factor RLI1
VSVYLLDEPSRWDPLLHPYLSIKFIADVSFLDAEQRIIASKVIKRSAQSLFHPVVLLTRFR